MENIHQKEELSDQWIDNKLRGVQAETLIEEMFRAMGWDVTHYGMEHKIPGMCDKLRNADDITANFIKRSPDFVIHHPEKDKTLMIEVKYRKDGRFHKSSLKGNPYDPAFLLLISPNSIKCSTIKEIREGILINKNTNNHLTLREEFEFSDEDKSLIKRFIEKIGKISQGFSNS